MLHEITDILPKKKINNKVKHIGNMLNHSAHKTRETFIGFTDHCRRASEKNIANYLRIYSISARNC